MTSLPIVEFASSGDAIGKWWSTEPDGRILCKLCPRACRLKSGDRGFCFVRMNRGGQMVLDTYGRSTGFCIDPIEKKPLNHFLPGTSVLSFGTAGCNLGCKFCQNWDISKSREVARLSDAAGPDAIAQAAKTHGCRSVAFTYNDPVIWAEYAIDTARVCRAQGIKSVAVTAGYITPEARGDFFGAMDAANIDLKGFTEEFYYHTTGAHLEPVLDTIRFVTQETDCWVELTNLVIPDANEDRDELRRMCDWLLQAVGSEVPIHFTAFHPDFRMNDRPRTSHDVLIEAYEIAVNSGLRHVYVGNVHDVARQSTYCPSCGQLLIERDWYELGRYQLAGDRCLHCQAEIAGVFEKQPGTWGQRRQAIRIGDFSAAPHRDEHARPQAKNSPQPTKSQPTKSRNPTKTPNRPTHVQEAVMDELVTTHVLEFDSEEQRRIHQAACQVVFDVACGHAMESVEESLGALGQRKIAGLYVTLKRGRTLRGCCGFQGGLVTLASGLVDAATRTTREDPRMPPISAVELPHLHVSVSILGPPRPIKASGDARVDAVEVGKHGLRIQLGNQAGLLLPSVARERGWSSRQFLDAVCQKAGLPAASWRSDKALIQLFDGVDFGGPLSDRLEVTVGREPHPFSASHLDFLARWVGDNLRAMQDGATPNFYCQDVTDGLVPVVALQIDAGDGSPCWDAIEMKLRDGVPIQSTLYRMTQLAAAELAGRVAASGMTIRIGLLTNLVHHGADSDCDLRGIDRRDRAVLLTDGRRCLVAFDPSSELEALVDAAAAAPSFRSGQAQVYSGVCDGNQDRLQVAIGPRGEPASGPRPPAVAGRFYPADDAQREALVEECLDHGDAVERRVVSAAMVPHAGLRYSGRIAGEVWRRIVLPRDVLIISPKHTAAGVDWAVAPHETWQLSSTAGLPGAVDLARQIAEHVPGMELDAAAHRDEHGIEVQLPLLYRFAPQTRVAAIAMHGGTFAELQAAASSLGDWLSSLDQPPLLVISSDMNHFADDQENRRRDALALAMLERNDPRGLLQVCERENISMCGRIPAAFVLLTLKQLGVEPRYDQVAYATSGDVSGDRNRVVGYAGVLF